MSFRSQRHFRAVPPSRGPKTGQVLLIRGAGFESPAAHSKPADHRGSLDGTKDRSVTRSRSQTPKAAGTNGAATGQPPLGDPWGDPIPTG
jgi:hypothetical protein